MNLTDLASKYGTDKLEHGYIQFYEKHLPKDPKRILEIGVKEGRSLAMWREFFSPETEIHGLDLFQENTSLSVREYLNNSFPETDYATSMFLHTGNQCDWQLMEQLRKYEFDVIIDDGSHNSRDQMMTFFGLYNGKHYFIEDIHCCREEFYQQGIPLGVTAKKIFNEHDNRYKAIYAHSSPIVLIQNEGV